ncbi:hypothetical protein F441_10937 [Phytophthora nicotianae CJ01A1]|uniref:RXLR phytopathogen effector protein WY-domain domain-containing protein n=4 Tax=Phytophthora nicotianae TaxID=4792 RepID=W2Z461_PHYNI|nr:hypothetical protein L915_10733 [Phytophthora nicotianae]ETO72930.1 hypothetical protein F444_11083 [Phytophthora nicotianae P1976]ETP14090.1 hypothetical protein F441_10937 [Phytophthora nicotianae CJ01A1]ETP42157.1 hypothetical protein F442_10909 [Phytophthora nicotianae P10297]ETL37724.1 hypothetical protein L916_10628 [Phytophthora nicotianae]
MRALLLLAIVLVGAMTCLSDADQILIADSGIFVADKKSVFLKRALRSDDASETTSFNEEKAGILGSSKLTDLFIKLNAKKNVHPASIFQGLRVVKAGGKLDGNAEFIRWLWYVLEYRAKRGETAFTERELFSLLRQSKRTEEELVALSQSLRQVPGMKNIADEMQTYMILSSASSHRLMNEVWWRSRETPQQVFNILRLGDETLDDNPLFIQWLRYIKFYRAHQGSKPFSDLDALNFMVNARSGMMEFRFAALFQSIKYIPDLKEFAIRVQTHLYQRWTSDKITPNELKSQFGIPYPIDFSILSRTDPVYRTLVDYTMYFVEQKGGTALSKAVKKFFAEDNPNAALKAASKS